MNRIIGKIACILLLLPSLLFGRIVITTTNMHQQETTTIAVGEPFLVNIVVHNSSSSVQIPEIPGLSALRARRIGVNMTSINGNATIKHSYQAQADKIGTYTIGPVEIVINGAKQISNKVNLQITHNNGTSTTSPVVTPTHTRNQTKTKDKPFAVITTDMRTAYVGQKVACKLRCYYPADEQSIEIRQVHIPQVVDALFQGNPAAVQGTEIINQKPYRYVEWEWQLYPHKAGDLVIPAYTIDYMILDGAQHSFFGPLSFMFGGTFLERLHSNSLTIQVKPVPDYYGQKVTAVGKFTQLQASINPNRIQINEATTYTLTLTGNGNYIDIPFIELVDMPESVKWYKSTMKERNADADTQEKDFEYVLQNIQSGDVTIPEQHIITFDPLTQEHVVLTCPIVTMHVQDQPHIVQKKITKVEKKERISSQYEQEPTSLLLPLALGPILPYHDPLFIPWIVILLLAVLPLVVLAYMHRRTLTQPLYNYLTRRIRPYYAFYQARKELDAAHAHNSKEKIYTIFVTLVQRRKDKDFNHVNLCDIDQYLKKSIDRDAWYAFVQEIQEYMFTDHTKHTYTNNTIWQNAYRWLEQLRTGGL